ncbi:imidazole glycerol phosphate synthase subunit HisH [Buchnera aphidicola str. APS (Acyrthosiphon pisum)]|uniref:Imidazole glycerol phosphate synthase subunit HisH n=1 Tax=Buchnera aphidicola subsp. Acyrthosiphon pisum (strain APS) TaxID=107806 RepID=HIS5_BUCAI|nr:imidazole glycerol phosphate synthase subunit HisH [Buchnera aphidicola]P57204.1 RecName: Full=Imidazole glycerol phosphate synthase subunit HisH; AltName: Full=IGP synthase glutaminase subunit; AltName: Full=IGP synthase subunit HisH; AltName: Full=ImGP synthase subunit HisH; Short=IGPS subunit HisH [Buchnera aphidicola str. APS (Acyrthosiphon pisum)]pir/F84941/ amidotransferase hisH [imported] - Buchnera sp. (strain APS) [Buchnera sp. (in: enterobacteria)]BAB12822.1 amidotransferase hisH [B
MYIVIVDTGCANLTSIKVAINNLGYNATITSESSIILKSNKIFLPGVGTASAVMDLLSKKKIINVIRECKQTILGICLGMQLFCASSEESNGVKTIGIIKTPALRLKVNNLSLPHIGWNQITFQKGHALFKNIPNNSRFYFVHSYMVPINKYTLSTTNYGINFSSIIQKDNFFGVQFHPEKSGNIGSQLLKNFLEI